MDRKFLFIVNPRSGKRNSDVVIACIKNKMPQAAAYAIEQWTNIEEYNLIAEKISLQGYTDIVAVGGDGSVNLVGRTALKAKLQLGIIPTGSGNGLARTLGISMKPAEALEQILQNNSKIIDAGEVNGNLFFCTSGVGFDAHIGNLFANLKTRGLKTYIKLITKEFFSYQPKEYTISINKQKIIRNAFFITVANAGQFGNDFYIAPQAKLNDGLLHVVVVKPFSLLNVAGMLIKILRRKAHTSKLIETYVCSELEINRDTKGSIHYDGEPMQMGETLHYKVHHKALKVIVGQNYNCLM